MKIDNLLKILAVFLIIFISYNTFNYVQDEQKTINVGYLPSNHHSALFVAEARDMYGNAGIIINLVPFRSGTEIIEALEKGHIDVGYCGIAPTTMAISKGAKVKIVAPVNTGGSGLVVPVNSSGNISNLLQNKNVAVPHSGTVQDVLLHKLLADNNITPDSIHFSNLETPFMPASLKNGKIDAYVAWEPYVTFASINGEGKVFSYSEDWWPNHPCCVVVASDKFISEKPNDLSQFLKVHVEATKFIENNPYDSNKIISEKLGTNYQVQAESMKHLNFMYIPSENFIFDVGKFMEVQNNLGYIDNIPSYNSLYDFSFLNHQDQ
ncbi:MAG: ABC transporter substrate-binding protein [Methanobacterium sp.]|nr:MAG: ABC transporter substrate-binding protein [Methanobacterium sp.]